MELEMNILEKPLSEEEALKVIEKGDMLTGVIKISIDEMLSIGEGNFLLYIEERLFDGTCSGTDYTIVGHGEDYILLEVTTIVEKH